MVVVGNKCDLSDQRQVTKEQGIKLAKEWNVPFFETSAKTNINCQESYYQVVREIFKFERKEEEKLNPNKKNTRKNHCALL